MDWQIYNFAARLHRGREMSIKIMSAEEAVRLVESQKTLCCEGFVGAALAEELLIELRNRYLETGSPRNLTLLYAAGQGDGKERGLNHLGEEGLLKRTVGGHWNLAGRLQKLALEERMEAYNIPQGVIAQMYRDIAAGRPTISRIGLQTFVDPRVDGGRLNSVTEEEIVHLLEIDGEEYLKYDHLRLDYAFIRGTYADERGNISMEKECCDLGVLAIAEAVKNCGGTVFVQVEKVVKTGTLDPRYVRIPGMLVDVVVPVKDQKNHMQTFHTQYEPAFSGKAAVSGEEQDTLAAGVRRLIGRRCTLELAKDTTVNLGIGMSEIVGAVAWEEGIGQEMTFTIEGGPVGGIAMSGMDFGAMAGPTCIIDQASMFDFYDGGGLDEAFLGMAECDRLGNINVSKFGLRIAGAGGFINISQTARKVVFCGTFTAKGLEVEARDGRLIIQREGQINKFVKKVHHMTFNSGLARKRKQEILYITERAVFEMTQEGIMLTEIAPGIDLQKDVLDHIEFACAVKTDLKRMDERIFREEKMGIRLD